MTPPNRATMDADIVCVGFGPAAAGFLSTLGPRLVREDGTPVRESAVAPGMPLQVLCYERADDTGFGVSGVVTRARAIRASFPGLDPSQIPMATPVTREKVLYLLDPGGASRRSATLKAVDALLRTLGPAIGVRESAFSLPFIPPFLSKHGGLVLSMGQFCQWAASGIMASGLVQIWPGTPVAGPLIEEDQVTGVRLADQGTDRKGTPEAGYMPGMDVHASLTVLADGPYGPVSAGIDRHFGLPTGSHRREWALGMKALVQLAPDSGLEPGEVLHTFGYPEPDIFGFLYAYPGGMASLGIFIPSWLKNPVRTGYRYFQHWMKHPALARHLKGAALKSWGAKSLLESGLTGEPKLAGEGYARIGEGSGTTNVLTGSGVDEAWESGVKLAEGVLELLERGEPFTGENLERTYVSRRRASQTAAEAKVADGSRNGFHFGFVPGMIGTGLAGLSSGLLKLPGRHPRPHEVFEDAERHFAGAIPPEEMGRIREECARQGSSLHDKLMDRAGWPAIEMDGKLLISHQDVLLMGGKVQAPPGYADHVVFADPGLCKACEMKVCIEMCSGQAITPGGEGVPAFDREKCVHCGACIWNCAKAHPDDPELSNVDFRAGAGGLHSVEN